MFFEHIKIIEHVLAPKMVNCVRMQYLSDPDYVPTVSVSHYSDVIMSAMASLITGVSNVFSTICSGVDQRKHQSSASLAFVRGFHRWPVNSRHKGPVTRKMFPFDDVIRQHQNCGFGVGPTYIVMNNNVFYTFICADLFSKNRKRCVFSPFLVMLGRW